MTTRNARDSTNALQLRNACREKAWRIKHSEVGPIHKYRAHTLLVPGNTDLSWIKSSPPGAIQ